MRYIEAIEDRVVQRYGYEAKTTLIVFKLTELLRAVVK